MLRNPRSKVKIWLPPVLWAIVIFLFSSLTVTPASTIYWKDFIVKKSAHIFEYAVLAILLYRSLRESKVIKMNAIFLALLVSVVYGITDEIHQGFTPGREPRVRDVFFDTIGASSGLLLWRKYW